MAAQGNAGDGDPAHTRPPFLTATLVFLTLLIGSEQRPSAIAQTGVSTSGGLTGVTGALPASVVSAQTHQATTQDTDQFLADALARLRSNDLVRSAFAYREREI